MSSKIYQARGAARTWEVHDAGTSPACKGPCRAEQTCGIWLWNPVATTSTATANTRPSTAVVKRQRLLRSCLPFAARIHQMVVGHLLTDGMNALRSRRVPAGLHAKLGTPARKPEHAAYPAQMLRLRRTHEFPRPSISTRSRIHGWPPADPDHPCNSHHAGSARHCRRTPTRMIRPRPPATQRDHVVPINNVPPPPRRAPQQTPTRPRARSRRSARCTPRCTSALS
jgi:hypothetical protein